MFLVGRRQFTRGAGGPPRRRTREEPSREGCHPNLSHRGCGEGGRNQPNVLPFGADPRARSGSAPRLLTVIPCLPSNAAPRAASPPPSPRPPGAHREAGARAHGRRGQSRPGVSGRRTALGVTSDRGLLKEDRTPTFGVRGSSPAACRVLASSLFPETPPPALLATEGIKRLSISHPTSLSHTPLIFLWTGHAVIQTWDWPSPAHPRRHPRPRLPRFRGGHDAGVPRSPPVAVPAGLSLTVLRGSLEKKNNIFLLGTINVVFFFAFYPHFICVFPLRYLCLYYDAANGVQCFLSLFGLCFFLHSADICPAGFAHLRLFWCDPQQITGVLPE